MKILFAILLLAISSVAFAGGPTLSRSTPKQAWYENYPDVTTITAGDDEVMVMESQYRHYDEITVIPAHTSRNFSGYSYPCYRVIDKQFRVIINTCHN